MGTPLGNRVKRLREDKGWTQGELAYHAGVTRQWVSLVETGERERVNVQDVTRIARLLGTSVEYLVEGRSDEPDPRKAAVVRPLLDLPMDLLNRIALAFGRQVADAAGDYAPEADQDDQPEEPPAEDE